jgi:hypothetical protein
LRSDDVGVEGPPFGGAAPFLTGVLKVTIIQITLKL